MNINEMIAKEEHYFIKFSRLIWRQISLKNVYGALSLESSESRERRHSSSDEQGKFSRAFAHTVNCFREIYSPCVSESKTVLDSGFHGVDSGFQVLDSSFCQWNLDSGFVNGIPNSLSCIPDSRAQDSGFCQQNFPDSLTWDEFIIVGLDLTHYNLVRVLSVLFNLLSRGSV